MADQMLQSDAADLSVNNSGDFNSKLAGWAERSKTIRSIVKLPGDASTRKYYRVFARSGHSYILMRMEPFAAEGLNLPFLLVQGHLAKAGVEVPAVHDVDPERGIVLLEDLGDVTLLRRLQEVASSDVERQLYERVIDSLVDMHFHASPRSGKVTDVKLEAFSLRFDHEKLMWEINFTLEHFYDKYLQREMKPEDRALMSNAFSEICQILADEPTVFTHRDFHSRNVMVLPKEDAKKAGDRFVMIDFQDGRMGPKQYDLASLLRDSYYQLEETQVDRLIDYYIIKWEATSGEEIDRAKFKKIFDLMSVQRNFKAIGSFASFQNRRGNPAYLKYIGNTFENIRRTLLKYPEYTGLREVLFHYYYF